MNTEDAFTGRLSEYLDGELDAREHAAVDTHLAGCPSCRATLSELRAVVARAQSLADQPPAANLWPGVAARLGPRRAAGGTLHAFREAARRRVSFTLPQLAAAALALMVLSGGMVWQARSGNPRADFPPVGAESPAGMPAIASVADAQYDEAISDLEAVLAAGRTSLDAETVRVLEANLRAIDDAIEQSRRALMADPANTYLNNHLVKARQRKLALLRRASSLASAGT